MALRAILGAVARAGLRAGQLPFLLLRGSRAASSARIGRGAIVVGSSVGPYTYIGHGVHLNGVNVGSYCSIAAGVKIGGMEHAWWWGSTSPRLSSRGISGVETRIGDDVWIGANAVVRQGVTIGRGAVIGAGSVVLKDVGPYAIVAGVPAREIRKRFPESVVEAIERTRFWEKPPEAATELLDRIAYPPKAGGKRDQEG